MTTIYLNQKNRQIILNYIIDKVKKDFESTKIAKEIEEIKVKLIDYLRKEIEINYPVEDMKILEQYGLTKEYNLISIDVDFKRNCIYICLYSSFKTFKESVQLDFSPPLILIEDEYKIMRFLKNLVEDNKLIKDIIIKCAKLQCDYVSDIRKIIVAYDNRLNSKRTLKSLFKSYPKMKKLIDKEVINQIKSLSEKEIK